MTAADILVRILGQGKITEHEAAEFCAAIVAEAGPRPQFIRTDRDFITAIGDEVERRLRKVLAERDLLPLADAARLVGMTPAGLLKAYQRSRKRGHGLCECAETKPLRFYPAKLKEWKESK